MTQAFPPDLRIGAHVYSAGGERLGELKRLVLKRSDLSLSHVVVDIGFLRSGRSLWQGGLGLDYDRVVPIASIASVTGDRVVLRLSFEEFKDAPEYAEERYEGPADLSPGQYDLADVARQGEALAGALSSTGGAWVVERLNKPLDSIDVREGLQVWREQPHQKLGEVERGLFDAATGRLSAVVIKRGLLLSRDVILPARYISEVIDDVSVRAEISDADLDRLQEYRSQG